MPPAPLTLGRVVRTFQAGPFVVTESAYAPAAAFPRHYHEPAALSFAVRGGFRESVGRQTIDCRPFDVLIKPAGVVHSNRYSDRPSRCVLVELDDAQPARLFDSALARRLYLEMQSRDDAAALAVEALVLELLANGGDDEPRALALARAFVHAHASAKLTLRSIAHAAGVHPATIVRAFRAHLGCSPGEYVRRLRLDEAKRVLATTDRAIAEVALEAGFYDQSHFTAAFRKHVGVTPARYRRVRRFS